MEVSTLSPPRPKRPYIVQRHAGLLLAGFGLIALIFPATRNIMHLTEWAEYLLAAGNAVTGLLLLFCKSRRLLDFWILCAVACCAATAVAYTFSIGINTASWVYVLEIYFLTRLLGRVRADGEREHDG